VHIIHIVRNLLPCFPGHYRLLIVKSDSVDSDRVESLESVNLRSPSNTLFSLSCHPLLSHGYHAYHHSLFLCTTFTFAVAGPWVHCLFFVRPRHHTVSPKNIWNHFCLDSLLFVITCSLTVSALVAVCTTHCALQIVMFTLHYITMFSILNHCLNSMQRSLSLNFTPQIHLIILISARCNGRSFSPSVIMSHFHVSLHSCIINLCSQQQGTVRKKLSDLKLKPTSVNPGCHCSISISIHRQHIPR